MRRFGYDLRPVEADANGMDISQIGSGEPAGLILLTPSHQYPTGSIMSIQRRFRLYRRCRRIM